MVNTLFLNLLIYSHINKNKSTHWNCPILNIRPPPPGIVFYFLLVFGKLPSQFAVIIIWTAFRFLCVMETANHCFICAKKKSKFFVCLFVIVCKCLPTILCRTWCQAARVQREAGLQPPTRCYAKTGSSSKWTQIHGNISSSTDILFTL